MRKPGNLADWPVYKKALKYDSNHPGALEYLGELYIGSGEFLKAKQMYERLERVDAKEAKTLKAKLDRAVTQAKQLG